MRSSTPFLALALGLLLPISALAEDKIQNLATQIARLRTEVEQLAAEVEDEKTDLRNRLRSMATQQAELEVQLKREQVRLQQANKRQAEHKAAVEQQSRWHGRLRPVVEAGARQVKAAIGGTLPFKRKDRLAEVDRILDRMNKKLIGADDGVARLWERVEDELRLARESGLYTQEITLDGKKQLVEVARVGMVMLLFRTNDGKYGAARRQGDGWTYELLTGKQQWAPVAMLFDQFKKQLRSGFFRLPNLLPVAGGEGAQP